MVRTEEGKRHGDHSPGKRSMELLGTAVSEHNVRTVMLRTERVNYVRSVLRARVIGIPLGDSTHPDLF